jgi:hypothetical protein
MTEYVYRCEWCGRQMTVRKNRLGSGLRGVFPPRTIYEVHLVPNRLELCVGRLARVWVPLPFRFRKKK